MRGGEGRGDILERASPTWSLPFWIETAGTPRTCTVSFVEFFGLAVLCTTLFEDAQSIGLGGGHVLLGKHKEPASRLES